MIFQHCYTSIPHKKRKERIALAIKECFNKSGRQYIHIGKTEACWSRSHSNNKISWDDKELIKHIRYLIDNIYVVCGDTIFRQIIGIPMGIQIVHLS